jgi:hypothetical protein
MVLPVLLTLREVAKKNIPGSIPKGARMSVRVMTTNHLKMGAE